MNHPAQKLRPALARARAETDRLFDIVAPAAMYERPIAQRHRIIFYLGHFEAFDWNMVCATTFGLPSLNAELDKMFAFGIDPVDGKLPEDKAGDWPDVESVLEYQRRVRFTLDALIDHNDVDVQMLQVAIEHRLMHAETLAYMLNWLPYDRKVRSSSRVVRPSFASQNSQRKIPAGLATLGQGRNGGQSFGWDNEFDGHAVAVPEFSIDALNITNAEFMRFMAAGGYDEPSFWSNSDWAWIQANGIRHPKFWIDRAPQWFYRTMFEEIPLPPSWPVYVSHAEASAYARWAHKLLPTEAQFHRAAFGTWDGLEREYPWGAAKPSSERGNFDFESWQPCDVGAFPAGDSAFGVSDLVGNGWEWTRTPFAPFEGFEPLPFYPGYSADFFDGKHFVLKGASSRTAAALMRRSFRNWFQPHYPNIYATFRCVEQ